MAHKKINLSGHQNQALNEMGYEFPGVLHVDLTDEKLGENLVTFLKDKCDIKSGDSVTIAPPGLAPLAMLVLASIHGVTGQFPNITPLVRNSEGAFEPQTPVSLQDFRNKVARVGREDVVNL